MHGVPKHRKSSNLRNSPKEYFPNSYKLYSTPARLLLITFVLTFGQIVITITPLITTLRRPTRVPRKQTVITLLLTLWGLTSQKIHRGGLGLGGSVHEEAHPCFPYLVQPSFKGIYAGSMHLLVQPIPSINHSALKNTYSSLVCVHRNLTSFLECPLIPLVLSARVKNSFNFNIDSPLHILKTSMRSCLFLRSSSAHSFKQ